MSSAPTRRGLFGLLAGSSASVAVSATVPEPKRVFRSNHTPVCPCGYQLMVHVHFLDLHGGPELWRYLFCPNPRCENHDKKFEAPVLALREFDSLQKFETKPD